MTQLCLRMRRNCNLELRLSPSSSTSESKQEASQNQQLTIFYNGKICVSDVTDLQARAILRLAAREMEEKLMKTPLKGSSEPSSPLPLHLPSPLPSPSPSPSPASTAGLYMKRSLESFLQKRRNRVQAASPYHR